MTEKKEEILNEEEIRTILNDRGVQANVIDDIVRMSKLKPEEFIVDDARIMEDGFKIADIFGGGYDVLPEAHKNMMLDNCIRLYSAVTLILQKNRAGEDVPKEQAH